MYTPPPGFKKMLWEEALRHPSQSTDEQQPIQADIALMETVRLDAIPLPLPAGSIRPQAAEIDAVIEAIAEPSTASSKQTTQSLPLDAQNRPYLAIQNPYEHPFDLADLACERYHEVMGYYPAVILLSALNWLAYGQKTRLFWPRKGGSPIPFAWETGGTYDVCVRGEVL